MTVKELYDLFIEFKTNDFHSLRKQVNWMFYGIIAGLMGIIANLIVLIVKTL